MPGVPSRNVAESYFVLGLVQLTDMRSETSVKSFGAARDELKRCVEKLKTMKDTPEMAAEAESEIKEIEELLPSVEEKMADAATAKDTIKDQIAQALSDTNETAQKRKAAAAQMASEAAAQVAASLVAGEEDLDTSLKSASSADEGKADDITHLVKRKRASSADANGTTETDGATTDAVAVNGDTDSGKKARTAEPNASNGTTTNVQE